jgi:hypothetical protein
MGAYIYKINKVIDTNIGKVGIMKYWYKPGSYFGDYAPRGRDSTIERLQEKYDGGVEYFMFGDKMKDVIGEGVLKHTNGRKSVAVNDCGDFETVGKLRQWKNERRKNCYTVEK